MIDFSNVTIKTDDGGYLQDDNLQKTSQESSTSESEVFLTDLFMAATGKLYPTERKKDLKLISGVYNYAQAITHRLMTVRGEHPMDFTLGISWNRYLGKVVYDRELLELELAEEIVNEVTRDQRTGEVTYLSVTFSDINVIKVVLVLTPVSFNTEALVEFTAAQRGD